MREDGLWMAIALLVLISLMAWLMPVPQHRPPTPPESLYEPHQR